MKNVGSREVWRVLWHSKQRQNNIYNSIRNWIVKSILMSYILLCQQNNNNEHTSIKHREIEISNIYWQMKRKKPYDMYWEWMHCHCKLTNMYVGD